jgi:hypothetical protein
MSVTTQTAYRLKVRVADSEFDAEGPEDTVKVQFEAFLAALDSTGKPSQNGKAKANASDAGKGHEDLLADGTWGRFYKLEGDEDVSLKVLPATDDRNADALVLLLYGYLMLRQLDAVPSPRLLNMAKKSGLGLDRIDRNIPTSHSRYISRGGTRKGCRYGLNNQGQAYAQGLLEAEAER